VGAAQWRSAHAMIARMATTARTIPKTEVSLAGSGFGATSSTEALDRGTPFSGVPQQKLGFDHRYSGLEENLGALDCVFTRWILQASLWHSRRKSPSWTY